MNENLNSNTKNKTEQLIELSDDEEVTVIEDKAVKKIKKSKEPTECLNIQCKYGIEFITGVPNFVLVYFKVRIKRNLKICTQCYEEACSYYMLLKEKLVNKESIYSTPQPSYTSVLNIDSDEEDLSPEEDEEPLDLECVDMIEKEISLVMNNVVTEYNLSYQINDSYRKLSDTISKLTEEKNEYLEKLDYFQSEIDSFRERIYQPFKPTIKELPPLDIDDSSCQSVESNSSSVTFINRICKTTDKDSQDVVAVSEEILVPPNNLPPASNQMLRLKLKIKEVVYAMRHNYKYAYKKGLITSICPDKGHNEYVVQINSQNSKKMYPSTKLTGKYLAYSTVSKFRFAVGLRVIAGFKEDVHSLSDKLLYYSGIVAEPPKAMNKFRYLIFFDDGCAQYVNHEHVRLICEPSVNPWDDVPVDNKEFIKKYLLEYPERPMVKLQPENVIKVEYQDSWLQAKVLEVDGSLVKMFFLQDSRTEWIYRGSSRLEPLYRSVEAAKRRRQTGERVRRLGGRCVNNDPYVEYTRPAEVDEAEENNENVVEFRAVARKSTSNVNKTHKLKKPANWSPVPIPGKIDTKKLINTIEPKKFVSHQCSSSCVIWTNFELSKIKNIGPLAIPLYFGFRRIISHFGGGKRNVLYKAPCGRQLRNMEEIHMYLRITKSLMTVDLFDFDYWVNCLNEFSIERCHVNIEDISQQKEKCPISCVNYIDRKIPDFSSYMIDREPRENVTLNLDPEFLCGCNCTDDCQDKQKCACWQLTIEGQKLIPDNIMDPNVGYHYRRLPERVITGIYECNQQCKCSKSTCLNRVVQHPLSQKLQLFKTEMKGWGLRCLNDIPQGAFICIYAGHLLTENAANEEGKNYGDEYLAELDYIEVIERIKEDYESDVPEELQEESKEKNKPSTENKTHKCDSPESFSDDETNENTVANMNNDDIRSRLRERKTKLPAEPVYKNKKKVKKGPFSIRKYYGDNEGEVFIMDAKCSGNIGRYLNHSCMPNVFVQNVFVDTHDLRFPWVAFFAQTYIMAGTELTWDYNYDIGSVEGKIKYCYCGSSKCRGRLL